MANKKISEFVGQTTYLASDLINIVRNSTNYTVPASSLATFLGVTGTITPVANADVDLLEQPSSTTNNIRGLEAGLGTQVSLTAQNNVQVDHNFANGATGASIIQDLTSSQTVFRGLVAGNGITTTALGDIITIDATVNAADFVGITGTQTITGTKTFSQPVTINNNVSATGTGVIGTSLTVGTTLGVTGATTLSSTADITGNLTVGGDLNLPQTSGVGIKLGTTPTFGWKDLIGNVSIKGSGATAPAFQVFRGNNWGFAFAANDVADFVFHMPHDYAPNTDILIHVHWSHNGTVVTGNAVFTHYTTYAKRDSAIFPAEVTNTITYATVDIATTPQYQHLVTEIPLSTAGGSASTIDTASLEPDGLVLLHLALTTLPTITGGDLYIHTADIHYQSTNLPTKNNAAPFYT